MMPRTFVILFFYLLLVKGSQDSAPGGRNTYLVDLGDNEEVGDVSVTGQDYNESPAAPPPPPAVLHNLPVRQPGPRLQGIFLARDVDYNYFKVKIPFGQSMKNPNVLIRACKRAGLRPVCDDDYYRIRQDNCVDQRRPIHNISERMCKTRKPMDCPAIHGLFAPFQRKKNSAEEKLLGARSDSRDLMDGTNLISGRGRDYRKSSRSAVYFALCAKQRPY